MNKFWAFITKYAIFEYSVVYSTIEKPWIHKNVNFFSGQSKNGEKERERTPPNLIDENEITFLIEK